MTEAIFRGSLRVIKSKLSHTAHLQGARHVASRKLQLKSHHENVTITSRNTASADTARRSNDRPVDIDVIQCRIKR